MTIELNDSILRDAVATWGESSQVDMLVEETSELLNAIMKFKRGRASVEDVLTEIADVEIMLGQMEVIFAQGREIDLFCERHRKMERLADRLAKYKEEHK